MANPIALCWAPVNARHPLHVFYVTRARASRKLSGPSPQNMGIQARIQTVDGSPEAVRRRAVGPSITARHVYPRPLDTHAAALFLLFFVTPRRAESPHLQVLLDTRRSLHTDAPMRTLWRGCGWAAHPHILQDERPSRCTSDAAMDGHAQARCARAAHIRVA